MIFQISFLHQKNPGNLPSGGGAGLGGGGAVGKVGESLKWEFGETELRYARRRDNG